MPSSPLLSSLVRGLSCGVLEVRFALTLSSFLIAALFWAQTPLLGFVALALLLASLLFVLIRLALLARYKPTRLYDIEPTEDGVREQQGGPRSLAPTPNSPHCPPALSTLTPHFRCASTLSLSLVAEWVRWT